MEWRGVALLPLNIFVCPQCYDAPQPQLKSIVLPPDPVPVYWPLTEPLLSDEGGNSPVLGLPTGLDPNAVMPYDGATQTRYRVPLQPLSITTNGTTTVTVTFSAPHGLASDDQIAVEGLTTPLAAGFYTVTVTTATALTYTTGTALALGALLTPATMMFTVRVGLPYQTTQIPHFPDPNYVAPEYLATEDGLAITTEDGNTLAIT